MKRVFERKFQSFRFMWQLLDKEVQSFSVLHNIVGIVGRMRWKEFLKENFKVSGSWDNF